MLRDISRHFHYQNLFSWWNLLILYPKQVVNCWFLQNVILYFHDDGLMGSKHCKESPMMRVLPSESTQVTTPWYSTGTLSTTWMYSPCTWPPPGLPTCLLMCLSSTTSYLEQVTTSSPPGTTWIYWLIWRWLYQSTWSYLECHDGSVPMVSRPVERSIGHLVPDYHLPVRGPGDQHRVPDVPGDPDLLRVRGRGQVISRVRITAHWPVMISL